MIRNHFIASALSILNSLTPEFFVYATAALNASRAAFSVDLISLRV